MEQAAFTFTSNELNEGCGVGGAGFHLLLTKLRRAVLEILSKSHSNGHTRNSTSIKIPQGNNYVCA